MTKPVKTKATPLLVSLRDDIEQFLDALFGELDRLRLGRMTTPAAAATAAMRAASCHAPRSTPAVKPSPTLATPPPWGPVGSRQKPRRNLNAQPISSCG